MRFGLREETIVAIKSVFKKFPAIEEAVIYGSRAKGNYRNGSDIDLALKGKGLNLQLLNELGLEMDDLLLPYLFDLSLFEQIDNADLIDHIKRVGQIFYRKH